MMFCIHNLGVTGLIYHTRPNILLLAGDGRSQVKSSQFYLYSLTLQIPICLKRCFFFFFFFYNLLHDCRSTGSSRGLGSVAALCRGLSRRGTVPLLSSTNGHGSDQASLRQTDTRKRGLAVGVIRLKVQTSLWSV